MDKIWVRNVPTNDINEVVSLDYGSEDWKEEYLEMIGRGYQFEIGSPRGNVVGLRGLYLANPLDIQIEPSEYYVVNNLNEEIKKLQDSVKAVEIEEVEEDEETEKDTSLLGLFEDLDATCGRAKDNYFSGAMMFAPDDAIGGSLRDQEELYNQVIEAIKTSTKEERNTILNKTFSSSNLTDSTKLNIVSEIISLTETLSPEQETISNQDLIKLFNELDATIGRARDNSGVAMLFAPDAAIGRSLRDQEDLYNQLIETIKVSQPDDKKNIIKSIYASTNLIDRVKVGLVKEILESLGEYTPTKGTGYSK